MKAFFHILLLSFLLLAGTAQAGHAPVALAALPPQTEQPGQGPADAPIKAVPRSGHQAKPRRLNDNGQPNDRRAARAARHARGPRHGAGGHGRHH